MRFYKNIDESQPRSYRTIPGYCCVDMGADTSYGLYHVATVDLECPVYSFEVGGYIPPWPFDDIVSAALPTERLSNEQVIAKLNDMGIQLGDTGHSTNESTNFMRCFKPGWLWNEKIEAGRPGESIINIPVQMNLVDGKDLQRIISFLMGWSAKTRHHAVAYAKSMGRELRPEDDSSRIEFYIKAINSHIKQYGTQYRDIIPILADTLENST